ncbi:MAG TPA: orotidine 5'-phosphate decarboxylase / HUMPS family protein [Patescibacteria group bacterium]|nr:orotidine 5'-phosphate decarboxylase / HUMPS family protein [Patescibacteria group bacterium]
MDVANLTAAQRVITALDVDHPSKAIDIVKRLGHYDCGFKQGRQLIERTFAVNASAQDAASRYERDSFNDQLAELFALMGNQVMLDIKEHDIANTVVESIKSLAGIQARMMTIHASNSMNTLKQVAAIDNGALKIGVTALTDMDPADCNRVFGATAEEAVVELAGGLIQARFDGLVCAPGELEALKEHGIIPRLMPVCPNSYPVWFPRGDQNADRGDTPGIAISNGAVFVVIGRAITRPPEEYDAKDGSPILRIGSSERALELIIEDIEQSLKAA